MLVLDIIEILPPLGKYKHDSCRILPVKCYIANSVRLWSCIQNINKHLCHFRSFRVTLSLIKFKCKIGMMKLRKLKLLQKRRS
jgi:hypothetical protein